MGNPFASPIIQNLIEIEASQTPKQGVEVGRLKSKKGRNRKAVATASRVTRATAPLVAKRLAP